MLWTQAGGATVPLDICERRQKFWNFTPCLHRTTVVVKLQVRVGIKIKTLKLDLPPYFPPTWYFFPFSEMQEYKEKLLSFYDGSQFWLFDVFFLMYRHGYTWFFSPKKKKILEEKCWRMCWFWNHNPKLPISEGWHIRATDFTFVLQPLAATGIKDNSAAFCKTVKIYKILCLCTKYLWIVHSCVF